MRAYIEKIRQLDMDQESIEAMLYTNGMALLGLHQ
jgi:hypothetical protein